MEVNVPIWEMTFVEPEENLDQSEIADGFRFSVLGSAR